MRGLATADENAMMAADRSAAEHHGYAWRPASDDAA
jgi:hypothetical protein